ncbi:MAG: carboxymuconolactone decarboxylase family protein [Burkholderiaceae bacterium]
MTQRVKNHFKRTPEATRAMMALEGSFKSSGLEPKLQDLVRMRAPQINGCAFCIGQHATDALALDEDAMRLHLLDGWHESALYSERERAALAWTQALTRVSETHAPDDVYTQVKAQFSDAGHRIPARCDCLRLIHSTNPLVSSSLEDPGGTELHPRQAGRMHRLP